MNNRRLTRKGSATLEFITMLPLVFFMCLFVWQFVISGMAVMETQTLVRDGVRLVSYSKNVGQEEKRGKKSFDATKDYRLIHYEVKVKDGIAKAKATTRIEIVFYPTQSFQYDFEAASPIIE
ncbi:pilus assembly protein [Hazenella sp. IB182357]|uniref:Pilus assembly protein n=1 Tax=Polycladospora coralii TaxID=2771432 RepID=A0A926RUD4_9BACL|nr:TadE family protein [Polycladospora coralii]MBD1372422.1 pilus assembly protein [Polycladospora coralii]